jgi:hypothetical protein
MKSRKKPNINLKSDGFLQASSIVPIHTAESEPFLHSSEQHNGKKKCPEEGKLRWCFYILED